MRSNQTFGTGLPRWIEILLAVCGLVLTSPLLMVCMLSIRLGSPGPSLFRQQRVGRRGRSFVILKLRTMYGSRPGLEITAGTDPRITPIGKWLRRTKLDELPELWNVVRGDMSLVGPRPEVPRYVELDSEAWQRALSVRPGITDPTTLSFRDEESLLASIEGDRDEYYRNELLPKKLEGYRHYLERRTPATDLRVLVETVWKLVSRGH